MARGPYILDPFQTIVGFHFRRSGTDYRYVVTDRWAPGCRVKYDTANTACDTFDEVILPPGTRALHWSYLYETEWTYRRVGMVPGWGSNDGVTWEPITITVNGGPGVESDEVLSVPVETVVGWGSSYADALNNVFGPPQPAYARPEFINGEGGGLGITVPEVGGEFQGGTSIEHALRCIEYDDTFACHFGYLGETPVISGYYGYYDDSFVSFSDRTKLNGASLKFNKTIDVGTLEVVDGGSGSTWTPIGWFAKQYERRAFILFENPDWESA
ncbi:hypothetical protein [Alsobacter sp. R-9]